MPRNISGLISSWIKKQPAQSRLFALWYWLVEKWVLDQNRRRYARSLGSNLPEKLMGWESDGSPQTSPVQFGIILIAGKAGIAELNASITSVCEQEYPYWKLFVSYYSEPGSSIRESTLKSGRGYAIEWIKSSEGGSMASVLEQVIAKDPGSFIGFLTPGDLLSPHGLFRFEEYLARCPTCNLVYSDEDQVGVKGKHYTPIYKPDWSPDLLFSGFYTGRFSFYRTEMIGHQLDRLSGESLASEYAIALQLASISQQIGHIPEVLYSRLDKRKMDGHAGDQNALANSVKRIDPSAEIVPIADAPNNFKVNWTLLGPPLISIIICTRDKPDYLNRCVVSIIEKSRYQKFEVVLVDNGSREEKAKEIIEGWKRREPERFQIIRLDVPFNFSKLNNQGAAQSRGDLLLFLNNDVELVSSDGLEQMAAYAQRQTTGAVSAMLIFPNGTVQHAGIIVGGTQIAVHSHYRFPAGSPGYMGRLKIASNYSAVTAACMMIKKDLFINEGGFDEKLEIAYNDVDLCLRLRKSGYFNVVLPYIRLIHHESVTRGSDEDGERKTRLEAERALMIERWPQLLGPDPFYHPLLSPDRGNFLIKQ